MFLPDVSGVSLTRCQPPSGTPIIVAAAAVLTKGERLVAVELGFNDGENLAMDKNVVGEAIGTIQGVLDSEVGKAALLPVAKETGKALGTLGKAINAALLPVSYLVWRIDQVAEWLMPSLEEKLKNVPPERVVTPKANVAGPIIEAMRFAADEPELREMFANLLATAMDSETARNAHPAFVEFIRQMTPDEAMIVAALGSGPGPFRTFAIHNEQKKRIGAPFLIGHPSFEQLKACSLIESHLDNLSRLGLMRVHPNPRGYLDSSAVRKLPRYALSAMEQFSEPEKIMVAMHDLRLTNLGTVFYAACVRPND